jgi:hypothetical protein
LIDPRVYTALQYFLKQVREGEGEGEAEGERRKEEEGMGWE